MKNCLFAAITLLTCTLLQAQELTLFEELQSSRPQQTQPLAPVPANQPRTVASSEPEFTLRSTARFGDDYRIVLQSRNGETISMAWQPNSQTGIPQYSGYKVVDIAAGTLTLKHPASSPCIENKESGVDCIDQQTSRLSLVHMKPLQNNGTPAQRNTPAEATDPGDDLSIEDPFAAAIAAQEAAAAEPDQATRAERARIRAERMAQFEPVRIQENEVPAGMRVIRTPFGDRLVPAGD